MLEDRVEGKERQSSSKQQGRVAERDDDRRLHGLIHDIVDRMHPRRGKPIQVSRAVMDRMKRPKLPVVKCAMESVAGEVDENDHLQSLVEPRLAAKRPEALKQIFKRSGAGEQQ